MNPFKREYLPVLHDIHVPQLRSFLLAWVHIGKFVNHLEKKVELSKYVVK